jgi:ABC-type polysaccharide/polyol phosphate transport system ATPase subunit
VPELAEDIALRADGLSKRYTLGNLQSLSRTLALLTRRPQRDGGQAFDALSDVNFSVCRGESIGIIGSNGAGKSTLLQILAGTIVPSGGSLTVRGRVLPLLAVGLGFHPDLTGRENVMLFGTTVGLPLSEIRERMDDVIEFSGVGVHIDTPIKRFSSGMTSRLSVAIAVQFPADVYIFDEVLAVVDAEFQDRCLEEIHRLHSQGRTVFFVSHHREQVASVCDRVLWLDQGRVREFGESAAVLDAYQEAHHHVAAG